MPPKSTSIGGFGEFILNDPTSEGVEAHVRYGFSDELNAAGIVGTGSTNKGFRLGGELVYNFFPDADGQFGVSAIGSMVYLKRLGNGGVQSRLAPMIHKKLGVGGYETTLYLAVPFYFEARSGTSTSGSQVAFGSLFDISRGSRTYLATELGLNINKSESYLLLGIGFRYGELKWGDSDLFQKREPRKAKKNEEDEKEYRTEDFDKPIK